MKAPYLEAPKIEEGVTSKVGRFFLKEKASNMRASTSLEEGAPILVGCHTIYRGRHQERGAPLHLVERQAIMEGVKLKRRALAWFWRALLWRSATILMSQGYIWRGRLLGPTFL